MSKTRSLSAVAGPIARKALGKRFAALGALLEDWPHIVGSDLAGRTQPVKLDFPHGQRQGGVLSIRTASADALELQHEMPRVLERLNGHFGYRAVDRIKLIQAPPKPPRTGRVQRTQTVSPADSAEIANALSAVENPSLRHHLERMADALLEDGGARPMPSNRQGRST